MKNIINLLKKKYFKNNLIYPIKVGEWINFEYLIIEKNKKNKIQSFKGILISLKKRNNDFFLKVLKKSINNVIIEKNILINSPLILNYKIIKKKKYKKSKLYFLRNKNLNF